MASTDAISRKLQIALMTNTLLEDHGFDEISIGEICRAVGISRSTFYRFFEDKYAIHDWLIGLFFMAGVRNIGRCYTWYDGLRISLSGLLLIYPMMRAFAKSKEIATRGVGTRFYKSSLIDTLVNVKHRKLDEKLLFQIDFYSNYEPIMINTQISKDEIIDVDRLAELLVSCVPAELKEAIDIPQSTKPVTLFTIVNFMSLALEFPDPAEIFENLDSGRL